VASGAIERFLTSARALGAEPEVRRFPQGTKTAQDAAAAIGCDVAQIVKSLVFTTDDGPLLALTSGANRADERRLAELAGAAEIRRATPEEARAATGYAVGGTPPLSMNPVPTYIDETLLGFDTLWAAAGTPDSVFPISPNDLVRSTGGTVAAFTERPHGGGPPGTPTLRRSQGRAQP
jgi:prolyl-tRNA editing enzyme YbaK/EbsC (Cys-tRNA(Pro) deacylase)